MGNLQAIAWEAEKTAHKFAQKLKYRLEHGASQEAGELHFDANLEMARRQKREEQA